MKKYLCSLLIGLLMGSMLIYPVSAGSVFPDVDNDAPYAEAVGFLNDAGIMKGSSSGDFNPNSTVTRAEMATILCNMLGEADDITPTGGIFTDVPKEHWASGYIAKAAGLGFISGYGNGYFGINDTVTYEQAITMFVGAMGLGSNAIEAGGYPNGYISIAKEKGLAGSFEGKTGDLLTRWQVADIVFGAFA